MDIWQSFSGMVEAELTSANPVEALRAINSAGIELYDTRQVGDLTVHFRLRRQEYRKLLQLTQRRGERLRLSRKKGMYWSARQILRRPVLLLGISLLISLTLYLPGRILFIEVEGNQTVPSALIIERAEQCGIGFGSSRRTLRSEQIKNALLQAIPELQWAGVNTYGCRAVISVREKPVSAERGEGAEVSSIVASRDGVISEITVQKGNRVCSVGQAVKRGQVLISGYTDCGICIRATRAEGEVFANTKRSVDMKMPIEYEQKGEPIRQEEKYSLLIGKKQINFCKDSGIFTTSCDKMYSVKYITLPGGFQLPLAIVKETSIYYDTAVSAMDEKLAQTQIAGFADQYLLQSMTAGQILQRYETTEISDDFCNLQGQYICQEMIGKTRLEENLEHYGETD